MDSICTDKVCALPPIKAKIPRNSNANNLSLPFRIVQISEKSIAIPDINIRICDTKAIFIKSNTPRICNVSWHATFVRVRKSNIIENFSGIFPQYC